ncbi:MAG: methylisocitrate lyase [Candidatus Manganitrophaceae bacterium]
MGGPGRALRQILRKRAIIMPGAFNAFSALLIERTGFEAVYVTGAGMANGVAGVPDIGLLSLTEVVTQAGYIARAVKIPALADADTGFGEGVHLVRAVEAFEAAGVAGIQIEDQQFPKRCGHLSGKRLIPTREMVRKIKTAVRARRDPDFLIVARTDAGGVTGFSDALDRARRYADAGADVIFPEALTTEKEFLEFARRMAVPLLANMTEFGKSPLLSVEALSEMGYRIILFPMTLFRAAAKAMEETLAELKKEGTSRGMLGRMQTRQALYDVVRYADFERLDRDLASTPKRITRGK